MRVFKLLTIVIFIAFSVNVFAQDNFASSSVLKTGTWYKVKIKQSGVFKLTYEDILSMGFATPENIRIYGNGGRQLPLVIGSQNNDDLGELPIYANNGSDNIFGPGDYYLFYGEGIETWNFNSEKGIFAQRINDYSLFSYYFLTTSFGSGERITEINYSNLSPNQSITEYDWHDFHELELTNLIQSGRRWYGDRFEEDPYKWDLKIDNLNLDKPIILTSSMAVRSDNNKTVTVKANSNVLATLQFSKVQINNQEALFADTGYCNTSFFSSTKDISIGIGLNNSSMAQDQAYLDYVTLNARCMLNKNTNPFFFRDYTSIGSGNIARYYLSNSNQNTRIWNISKHNKVYEVKGILKNSTYEFIAPNDTLQEYIALDLNFDYPKPILKDENFTDVGPITNQNLHGKETPEFLIVTHPSFIAEADSLAEFHRRHDNMVVNVVTTEQIYNEFSSGKEDISAIRNFARMLWVRSTNKDSLKYLLLFGDGSYDNRTKPDKNPNYIPTYQSVNSQEPIASLTSDDFYGMLEPGEWNASGSMEIGVGRIPVIHEKNVNITQAMLVVKKITSYYNVELMRDWRNTFMFLADDGENEGYGGFMIDADALTQTLTKKSPALNFNKIYLDAYEQKSASTGATYPDVEKAIIENFNKGALVFNYMGHGGGTGLTQELVLQVADVEKLVNAPYFPLFITATCQLGRFDNVDISNDNDNDNNNDNYSIITSLGEAAMLNPNGGAISLLTTTRLVFQSSNFELSSNVYYYLFKKDANGNSFRLGDIIRLAKNKTHDASNKFKFTLLGDPALTLSLPQYLVLTDSINEYSSKQPADTLNALGNAVISGFVADYDSTIMKDFNGIVQIKVFDKKYMVTTRGNDGIPTFDFSMQDRLLYRGKASVINGRFKAEFKVPKDITYSLGKGKISYYAQNGKIDASGYFENFIIGGTADYFEPDNDGPQILLYINDKSFKNDGITGPNPVLLVDVFDENGINTTGNGIGHDIMGVLDEDYSQKYLLNDYFEGDLDNFQRGTLRYPFSDLDEGHHTINVKVWDNYNNSSDAEIGFFVKQGDKMVIDKLFNYPNPMRDFTSFQYTHNIPGIHTVVLDIYDLSGRLVHSYHTTQNVEGFVSEPIVWQINTADGRALPPGVYPYRITVNVTSFDGINKYQGIQQSKLIIIP